MFLEKRDGQAGYVEEAVQVHIDALRPGVDGRIFDGGGRTGNTGIVDEDGKAAVCVFKVGEDPCNLIGLRNIGMCCRCRWEFREECVDVFARVIEHVHARADIKKPRGYRATNPGGSSRDRYLFPAALCRAAPSSGTATVTQSFAADAEQCAQH